MHLRALLIALFAAVCAALILAVMAGRAVSDFYQPRHAASAAQPASVASTVQR
jgi:hypothetical protein